MDRDEAMFLRVRCAAARGQENVITSTNAASHPLPRSCARARTARPLPSPTPILAEKSIFVIPDILANAGGVTVSYFEWVQDRQGYFWNEQLVNERLEEIMVNSFNDVIAYAGEARRA